MSENTSQRFENFRFVSVQIRKYFHFLVLTACCFVAGGCIDVGAFVQAEIKSKQAIGALYRKDAQELEKLGLSAESAARAIEQSEGRLASADSRYLGGGLVADMYFRQYEVQVIPKAQDAPNTRQIRCWFRQSRGRGVYLDDLQFVDLDF